MKLEEQLSVINNAYHIRIFVGCQTVFDGIRSQIPEKEWNKKMRNYIGCDVLTIRATENVIVIAM